MSTNVEAKKTTGAGPDEWIQAVRKSHDSLRSRVEPLNAEQLRQPSYHKWSIAEVMSHLGSQAELFSGWVTAATEGTDPPGRETMQPVWDAWNQRSPEQQSADSIAYDERLVRQFEGLSEDQRAHMRLDLFGMDLDASGLARVRLSEHAVHFWDIAVALDPSAPVEQNAVDLLIDTLGFIASRSGKPQGRSFRLHVRTTDPNREFLLRVGDDVELTPWEDGPEDGELLIPAEAFLRLVYGRLDPDHTPPGTETSGSVSLDEVKSVFPGV